MTSSGPGSPVDRDCGTQKLSEKEEFLGILEGSRVHRVEVDTGGQIRCEELHFVVPGFLHSLLQQCNLLSKKIEDPHGYVRFPG
jgi:hypothetical protein